MPKSPSAGSGSALRALAALPHRILDWLLHPECGAPRETPLWRLFWPILGAAFLARIGIALGGDFIIHPDEIQQYLEPAHGLVFGSGVVFWEHYYGVRSWLLPGLIAGILKAFDLAGLGEPGWYIGGVEAAFCLLSLAIPAGMYFFARRHYGELPARIALVAGAFWYELAGFAHKPMTEFVATALFLALLPLCARRPDNRVLAALPIALVAVLAAAIRLPYAALPLLVLGVVFLRARGPGAWPFRATLFGASLACLLAVGAFDAATWDSVWFHSYIANSQFNIALARTDLAGALPYYQYPLWLLIAAAGLAPLILIAAIANPKRYAFALLAIALVLVPHTIQGHKEYRYIFAAVPLWLLIGADMAAFLAARARRSAPAALGAAAALFAAVSAAGVLNALPHQRAVYHGPHQPEKTVVRFLRDQDGIFAAFRHLAANPDVKGIWQPDRYFHSMPGYYYLHKSIPYYDMMLWNAQNLTTESVALLASHIVAREKPPALTNYVLEQRFGDIGVWRRRDNDGPVHSWSAYQPVITGPQVDDIMRPYSDKPPPQSLFDLIEPLPATAGGG